MEAPKLNVAQRLCQRVQTLTKYTGFGGAAVAGYGNGAEFDAQLKALNNTPTSPPFLQQEQNEPSYYEYMQTLGAAVFYTSVLVYGLADLAFWIATPAKRDGEAENLFDQDQTRV